MNDLSASSSAPQQSVAGYLDVSGYSGPLPRGPVRVHGWVVDPHAPPLAIVIALNGRAVALAQHGQPRPDVALVCPHLPGAATSGWTADFETVGLPEETAMISVHVVRVTGETVLLGESPFRAVVRPSPLPAGLSGSLDCWGDRGPLPVGRVTLQGWVIDHQAPPLAVIVTVDGGRTAFARIGRPRPDVAVALPASVGAATSGWEMTLDHDGTMDDRSIVTVQVMRSSGELVLLGRAPLREAARLWGHGSTTHSSLEEGLFGTMDPPAQSGVVTRGPLEVRGWAVDTQAPPSGVLVTIDGKIAAVAQSGFPRPDAAQAHPDLPGALESGWSTELDLSDQPIGTVVIAASVARAGGNLAEIGNMPVRIMSGLEGRSPLSFIRQRSAREEDPRVKGPSVTTGAADVVRTDVTTEIHVPISPTPGFFTRVHYLAASLRTFGAALAKAKLVVTVGDDFPAEDLYAAQPWSRFYPLEWRWVDRDLFRAYGYFATAIARFCYDYTSDVVLHLDADMLFVKPIDDLIARTVQEPALSGVIAQVSPAFITSRTSAADFWPRLFSAVGLPPPPMICEHPGWGIMDHPIARDPDARLCPPYFNLGFLCATRQIMQAVGADMFCEMMAVDRFLQTIFRCQLALTVAIQRTGVAHRPISARYNFPNYPHFVDHFPEDFDDVRIIHYHGGGEIDRDIEIGSLTGVGNLLPRRELSPINARLRDGFAAIHETVLAERSEGTTRGTTSRN